MAKHVNVAWPTRLKSKTSQMVKTASETMIEISFFDERFQQVWRV